MNGNELFEVIAGYSSIISLIIAIAAYFKASKIEKTFTQKAGRDSILAGRDIKVQKK